MSIIPTFDLSLIREVRKRRFLYDLNCRDYRDTAKKQAAWVTISQTCRQSVNACKARWHTLRKKYLHELNSKEKRIGSPAPTPRARRTQRLLLLLSFLKDTVPNSQDGTDDELDTQANDERENQEAESRCYEEEFEFENEPLRNSSLKNCTADISGVNNQLLNVLNMCAQNISTIFQQRKKRKLSPSEPFLMSLAPMMDQMNVCQRLQVQIDIMKCIQEAKEK